MIKPFFFYVARRVGSFPPKHEVNCGTACGVGAPVERAPCLCVCDDSIEAVNLPPPLAVKISLNCFFSTGYLYLCLALSGFRLRGNGHHVGGRGRGGVRARQGRTRKHSRPCGPPLLPADGGRAAAGES